MDSLARALYRHPAFGPHRLLGTLGLASFWARNTAVTAFGVVALTLCAWKDHSFIIVNGFGYLQHPGIWGWFLLQLVMPVAIFSTLKTAARSGRRYWDVIGDKALSFREDVFNPMVAFIGYGTPFSRSVFALLFLIGFTGFAWNTFQNLAPGRLAPFDFWDSIHFPCGYFGTRVYKFYLDALLLPSIVHVFAGVVWSHLSALRMLTRQRHVRLALFSPDRCGGFGFVADLILSPTIAALLVSGLAFFGAVYTHRTFDISTLMGLSVQTTILVVFYIVPTFLLRSVLVQVKKRARRELHAHQEAYYEAILSGRLHGPSLRDAHDYLRYFNDISTGIDKIPDWPHLAKASSAFGVSISPAMLSSLISVGKTLMKAYHGLP